MTSFRLKRWLHFCAGMLSFAAFTPAWADDAVPVAEVSDHRSQISFACNNFPPQKIESGSTDFPGFDVEFLKEAFQRSGIKVKTPYYPWNRALWLAEQGYVDGLCSCSYRADRDEHFLYSDVLRETVVGIFVLDDYQGPTIMNLNQLKDERVGVSLGYNLHDELNEAGIQAVATKDESLGLRMLQAKRYRYFYGYSDTVRYLAQRFRQPIRLKFFPLQTNPYYVCFSKKAKDSAALRTLFNQGLKEMRRDGTYDQILTKYLSLDR